MVKKRKHFAPKCFRFFEISNCHLLLSFSITFYQKEKLIFTEILFFFVRKKTKTTKSGGKKCFAGEPPVKLRHFFDNFLELIFRTQKLGPMFTQISIRLRPVNKFTQNVNFLTKNNKFFFRVFFFAKPV